MPRDHLPFFPFYPADWIQDTQILTLEMQGAWMKILCALHVAPERGRQTWVIDELRMFLGPRVLDILFALRKVADISWTDGNGNNENIDLPHAALITIASRRMIRDEQKRLVDLERSRRYEKANPKRHLHASDALPTPIRRHSDSNPTVQKSEVISHNSYPPLISPPKNPEKTLKSKLIKNSELPGNWDSDDPHYYRKPRPHHPNEDPQKISDPLDQLLAKIDKPKP